MENSTIEVAFIKSTKHKNVKEVIEPNEIKLSRKNFINTVEPPTNYDSWLEKDVFPSDETLANLASLSYDDFPSLTIDEGCPGWTVLTTAHNQRDGYHGAAYWCSTTQQLVIGHRGTCFSQNKALLADIEGIIFNRHTSQINSACTFVAFILSQFKSRDQLKPQISFTGHSLGAWLAQITTFSAEYLHLDESNNTFRVKSTDDHDYHPHTVTFESPGCRRMLTKLSKGYFYLYLHKDYEKWDVLDITNYLTSPNMINICNNHVGNLLQLSIKTPNKLNSCWLLYTLHYHSMDNIVEAMKAHSTKAHSTKALKAREEQGMFLGKFRSLFSGKLSIFRLAIGNFWPKMTAAAKTAKVEGTVMTIHSWPTFDPPEQVMRDDQLHPPSSTFWSCVRTAKNLPSLVRSAILVDKFEYKAYFAANNSWNSNRTENNSIDVGEDTLYFQLADRNGKLCSTSVFSERENAFLSSWFALKPGFLSRKRQEIKNELKEEKYISSDDLIGDFEMTNGNRIISCKSEDDLRKVINNVKQLFRLLPQSETTQMNREIAEESKVDITICTTMSLHNVEMVDEDQFTFEDTIGLAGFLCSEEKTFLLRTKRISDLEIVRILSSLTGEFRENCVLLNWNDLQHLSKFLDLGKTFDRIGGLIVLDCQNSELQMVQTFITSLLASVLNLNVKLIVVINADFGLNNADNFKLVEFKFSSFSHSSQSLLKQRWIRLQGREFQLNQLIDDEGIQNLSLETIQTLVNGETINIGRNVLKICDLKQLTFKFNQIIDKSNLKEFLQENIVNAIKAQKTDQQLFNDNNLVIGVGKYNSEKFKQLCRENVRSNVYWVEIVNENIVLRRIYGGDLFSEQNFSKTSEVANCVIRNRLVEENPSGTLILHAEKESDVTSHFQLSDEEKVKFGNNLNVKNIILLESGKKANGTIRKPVYEVSNRFLVEKSSDDAFFRVEHEVNFDEKLVILSDDPGMGKSVKLVEISEELAKLGWVIHVNLQENQSQIINLGEITLDAIIELLTGNSVSSEFEKELLAYRLRSKSGEPIFLQFDGFDEIEKSARDKFIEVLKFLKVLEMVRVWVTTRTDHKKTLEENLFGFSKSLEKFPEDLQSKYLVKFWTTLFNLERLDERRLENYAKEVLEEAKGVLGSKNCHFLGNPLHIRMLAEITFKLVRESIFFDSENLNVSQRYNLQSLFQSFVSVRFDRYFDQNIDLNVKFANLMQIVSLKLFEKVHGCLALRLLIPVESPKFFQHRVSRLKNDNLDDKLSALGQVGLIKFVNGKYQFIYQILADYFLADLLLNWIIKYEVPKDRSQHPRFSMVKDVLLKVVFVDEGYSFVRAFINERLKAVDLSMTNVFV